MSGEGGVLGPLVWLMRQVLEWSFDLLGSHGVSILVLNLVVNIALVPLYMLTDRWKRREQALRSKMQPEIDKIDAYYTGQERYYYIRAIHRRHGHSALGALRVSAGLLIQIPFFLAAYQLLDDYAPHLGASFGFLSNLGKPDGLLFDAHALPLVMTAANLATAAALGGVMSRSERIQAGAVALAFFIVLYDSPSGLVLYWTASNAFALARALFRLRRQEAAPDGAAAGRDLRAGPRSVATCLALAGLFPAVFFIGQNQLLVASSRDATIVVAGYVAAAATTYLVVWLATPRWLSTGEAALFAAIAFVVYAFSPTLVENEIYSSEKGGWLQNGVLYIGAVSLAYAGISRAVSRLRTASFALAGLAAVAGVQGILNMQSLLAEQYFVHDAIMQAKLERRPNIYFVLPDSYANVTTLKKLGINVSSFTKYLKNREFEVYDDYYASYSGTGRTMSSLFNMSHHYLRNARGHQELGGARDIVAGNNHFNAILRRNGYRSHFVQSGHYFLAGRACRWDSCWPGSAVPLLLRETLLPKFTESWFRAGGKFDEQVDEAIDRAATAGSPTFTYIHHMSRPGHTHNRGRCNHKREKKSYAQRIAKANKWMQDVIAKIIKKDPDAIVIIASDHGGYVTENCTILRRHAKSPMSVDDRVSALAAIRWRGDSGAFGKRIRTSATLMSVVIAYLAENPKMLEHLAEDSTFMRMGKDTYQVTEDGKPLWPNLRQLSKDDPHRREVVRMGAKKKKPGAKKP